MRGLSDRAELTKLRNHMTAPSVVNSAATQPLLKTPLHKVLLLYLGSRRPPGKATGARAQAADALTQRLARAQPSHRSCSIQRRDRQHPIDRGLCAADTINIL